MKIESSLLLSAALLLGTANAQSRTPATELPIGIDENGVANFSGETTSIQPRVCVEGCSIPVAVYRGCFYNQTLPIGDVVVSDQDLCDEWLCDREGYGQLVACLECIISNGNERPYGYEYNSSLTAAPTEYPMAELLNPPDGYMNETLANEWLANVVDRCSAADQTLDDVTTTVTATPTTTGPYATRVTSGQTVNQDVWTGLTEYSDRFTASTSLPWEAAFETIQSKYDAGSTGGMYTPTGAGASASEPSASNASESSPNAGTATVPMGPYAWCLGMLGLLWI